ncbi:Uridine kinase family protein [Serinibacter arcticus]|uniref:Uridine kinase family protein n=1 Tax=Serinibacter arcticus TaxID=1655435 RepID=A0A4Z1E433_9MICO|nr:Uridine kinase family protein [Serinibacter arcticus]
MPVPVPVTIEALAERAGELAAMGERRILGLVGAPGAGKSFLAERLAQVLGPDLAVVVPMDGFHLAQEVLVALGREGRKGAADTFDAEGYVALLRRLRAPRARGGQDVDPSLAGVVLAPLFRRDLEEPVGSAVPVRPDVPLVITEGNYLLRGDGAWRDVAGLLDEVWFVAPPEDLRRARLVARHESFGRSPREARERSLGSDELNARQIAATAGAADHVWRLV